MRPKPYPLEALRKIRSDAQDAAVLVHKDALAVLAAAQAVHTRAEQDADAIAERRSAATRTAAQSGAELAIAGAWAAKLQRDHVAAREVLKRTAAKVKEVTRAERLAQELLRQAYIERQVVERHYAKFAEAERKRLQKIEDDEMDDLIPHLMKRGQW
jgi:hypothetical protein